MLRPLLIALAFLLASACRTAPAGSCFDASEVQASRAYAALDRGDEAPCAELKPMPEKDQDGRTAFEVCRAKYYELAFALGLAVGAVPPGVCEGALETDSDFASLSKPQRAGLCGPYKSVPELCDRLSSLFEKQGAASRRKKYCLRFLNALVLGDGSACEDSPDPEDVDKCRQYVLFHAARSAGDASRCRGAEICLAFMGRAAEIGARHARRARDCAR